MKLSEDFSGAVGNDQFHATAGESASFASFPLWLRLTWGLSAKFLEKLWNKSRSFFNLAVEMYEVTSNKINNSALLPRDSRIQRKLLWLSCGYLAVCGKPCSG